ncbi:MAG: Serine/threonine-protein kinase PknD [Chlamydiia bacterium]|nr:Serine/threonine-protein kinase PknD [Chlamydiia bacterium]
MASSVTYDKKTIANLTRATDLMQIIIEAEREEVRHSFPLTEVDRRIGEIAREIDVLEISKDQLETAVANIRLKKSIAPFDLARLHGATAMPSKSKSLSLAKAITDKRSFRSVDESITYTERKIVNINNAIRALNQYLEIFRGIKRADRRGFYVHDTINLPEHLHRINDLMLFHGEDFRNFKFIGKGAWATAIKCTLAGRTFVHKVPHIKDEVAYYETPDGRYLRYDNIHDRDFYVLLTLDHPNVLKVYGINEGNPILEYANGGDLEGLLKYNTKYEHKTDTSVAILSDIASGVAYLHDHGVIHKDLKPANVFLQTEDGKTYSAKIGDFGAATSKVYPGAFAGTFEYMAPEIIGQAAACPLQVRDQFLHVKTRYTAEGREDFHTYPKITDKVDVWSMGHIIYEMVTGGRSIISEKKIGQNPKRRGEANRSTGIPAITYSRKENFRYEELKRCAEIAQSKWRTAGIRDPETKDLLLRLASMCLQKDPAKRPSMRKVQTCIDAMKVSYEEAMRVLTSDERVEERASVVRFDLEDDAAAASGSQVLSYPPPIPTPSPPRCRSAFVDMSDFREQLEDFIIKRPSEPDLRRLSFTTPSPGPLDLEN